MTHPVDILSDAKDLIDVIHMAGAYLSGDGRGAAIRTAAHEAGEKIKQAIDLLEAAEKPAKSGQVLGKAPVRTQAVPDLPARDRQRAHAYFEMESPVNDIHNSVLLMEMAAENTVFAPEGEIEKGLRARWSDMEGYRIMLLTEDEDKGLEYAMRHVGDMSRKLHAAYYAADESEKPAAFAANRRQS